MYISDLYEDELEISIKVIIANAFNPNLLNKQLAILQDNLTLIF